MTPIDWNRHAEQAQESCQAAAMEILDLQRFYTLAKAAVARFPTDGEETIPWELSDVKGRLTIHPGDEEDLISNFTEHLLPRYSIILMVSIMEHLFHSLRTNAGWGREQKSRGFGLPVPQGFKRGDIDRALGPLVARYLEIKSARNIIVHNRSIADESYVKRAGTLSRVSPGEQYNITEEQFWEAFTCCRNLITTIEMLWQGTCVRPA